MRRTLVTVGALLLVAAAAVDAAEEAAIEYDPAEVSDFLKNKTLHGAIELTDSDFADTVVHPSADGTPPDDFLVFFYAPWCGHCKATKPIFADAADAVRRISVDDSAKNFKSKKLARFATRFAMVDAIANTVIADAFRVKSYPTLLHFHKGQAFKYTGGRDVESFAFFSRFTGFARYHSPLVPLHRSAAEAFALLRIAPQRSLFLFGPGCAQSGAASAPEKGDRGARPACYDAAMALASNNKVHFMLVDAEPDAAFAADNCRASNRAAYCAKIRDAFAKASKGPNGETVVALSDIYEDDGAVPFTGSWDLAPVTAAPSVGKDEHKSRLAADLWSTAMPRLPKQMIAWATKVGALPVGDSDPGSLQVSFERDGGDGLIALLMVGANDEEAHGRRLLRGLAQRRYRFELRRAGGPVPDVPPAASGEAARGDDASDLDVVSDDDIDRAVAEAELAMDVGEAGSTAAAKATPKQRRETLAQYLEAAAREDDAAESAALARAAANASFLHRRKIISLHAVTASAEFAADFGTSSSELPVFTVYWPRHGLTCHTPIPREALREKADEGAVIQALSRAREALAAADRGDLTKCSGRDWPAAIVSTLVTRPFPELDAVVRRTGMGNLELVMAAGCVILVLALIPLAVLRGGDDDAMREEQARQRQIDAQRKLMARQRNSAAQAAANAALGH